MIDIKRLDDVMNYFVYAFIAYIILSAVVLCNFLKALYINKKCCEEKSILKVILGIDLLVDALCGAAMAAGIMFLGVLADNNALNVNGWLNRLMIVSIISFTIFILNAVVFFRKIK